MKTKVKLRYHPDASVSDLLFFLSLANKAARSQPSNVAVLEVCWMPQGRFGGLLLTRHA